MTMGPVQEVLARPAWALIRLPGEGEITLLGGGRADHELLSDLPLEAGRPGPGRRFDRLVCVPYGQIRERGFEVHRDETPLTSIVIDLETSVPVSDIEALASADALRTTGTTGFTVDDDEYAELVETIIRVEIATARAPTWSSRATTSPGSTTGTSRRRSASSPACSGRSAAPTGRFWSS